MNKIITFVSAILVATLLSSQSSAMRPSLDTQYESSSLFGSIEVGKKSGSGGSGKSSRSPKHTGGPIVGSGPTKGQVRSRNKDGSWRKKRSDAKS